MSYFRSNCMFTLLSANVIQHFLKNIGKVKEFAERRGLKKIAIAKPITDHDFIHLVVDANHFGIKEIVELRQELTELYQKQLKFHIFSRQEIETLVRDKSFNADLYSVLLTESVDLNDADLVGSFAKKLHL